MLVFRVEFLPVLRDRERILLFRWLLMVLDVVDRMETLRTYVGLFFHFMTNPSLCKLSCQILYRICQREHVTRFRVNLLVNSFQETGEKHTCLLALLALFLEYKPTLDLPGGILTRIRRSRLLTNSMYHVCVFTALYFSCGSENSLSSSASSSSISD
mmetsp:Transcript_42101/g.106229  ORF Transcript_42101/g.106229 Transcript_42101/m.106229 type:complete len:157 (+) Transcript_42101:255-725(+)